MKISMLVVISTALAVGFTTHSSARTSSPGGQEVVHSQNPEANQLFLKAREYLNKSDPRTGGTFANAREAIRLYQQAVVADPKFALAYVDMARAWMRLGNSNPDGASTDEISPHARADLDKAIALDPKLPDAHLMLAALAFNIDYDWEKAAHEYKVTLQLQPENADAHASYAAFFELDGALPGSA